MQATSIQCSPAKDGRRILGEKDANACLSPARSKQSLSVTSTPVKRTLFSTVSPKKLLPSPVFAGQKRSRDQVDEVEVNEHPFQPTQTLRGSPRADSQSPVKNPNQPQNEQDQQTEQNHDLDAQDTRVATPTRSTRDGSEQLKDENTPTETDPAQVPKTPTVPEDPDARKKFIQEKAALLRNTLQTAMRNVSNNQIDRRVSELEEHSRKYPRISLPAFSSPLPTVSYRSITTPQFATPRIGSMPDLSSTPCQQTPDLPRRRSPLAHAKERVKDSQSTPPHTLGSPMQLSSPPATVIRHGRTRETDENAGALTPSQQGDAVDGLLKLMNTAERQENPDAWSG